MPSRPRKLRALAAAVVVSAALALPIGAAAATEAPVQGEALAPPSESGVTENAPDQVEDHIFGFTILNDFSARDIQFREMEGKLGPCKGKHFACSSGPLLATVDELDWRGGLRMQARLNGETLCDGNSSEAIFGLDEVVAWASQGEILRPGWLLGSGTVNGGSTIEHDRKLSPGDNVELEIEGLGILQNTIGPKAEGGWEPKPRRAAGH